VIVDADAVDAVALTVTVRPVMFAVKRGLIVDGVTVFPSGMGTSIPNARQ
jgi:hypothetical protein